MKITIPQHSIVMLIGPSNCGKSYFADLLMDDYLHEQGCTVIKLSSDDERRKLLFADKHKHDPEMMTVSKQAFNLVHNQLDNYTQYPVNTDIVIVDATHLSKLGRADVINIAKKNNYNLIGVIFDYKDMDDYYRYADENVNKRVISDMIRTLRKTTLREIDKKDFKYMYRITSNNPLDVEFEYVPNDDNHGYQNTFDNVCIVGDIHGCYEELLNVLKDNKGIEISNDEIPVLSLKEGEKYIHHILIGDLVDKGPVEGVTKVIELIYKNQEFFTIVKGNHEDHNYKVLTGKIKRTDEENKLIDSFFDSVKLFDSNEDLKSKFFHLYENKMHYYVHESRFIITHAPCEVKYLGKTDKISLKRQNTIMYPKSKDYNSQEEYMEAREEFFRFLVKESESNYPTHVFGHVMLSDVFQNKNKYGIDTGCVVGNKLSTLTFMKENRKPFVKKYTSLQDKTQELIPLFRTRNSSIDISSLDIDLQKRIKWCAKNKVNFVSGTMSPADKDFETNDLESLKKGIEYFKSSGIDKIILEPKYMGSRCNILLHKDDITKTKLYSRNAFEIGAKRLNILQEEFDLFLNEITIKYKDLFNKPDAEFILFDGELLPWNAMGKDLIETDFKLAYKAAKSEVDILSQTGFEALYDALKHKYDAIEDKATLKPHEKAISKTIDGFKDEMLTLEQTDEVLEKYNHQLQLFGNDGQLEFKPFAVLKMIKTNGEEINFVHGDVSNTDLFQRLSDSPFAVINLVNNYSDIYRIPELEEKGFGAIDGAEAFWEYITQQKEMEGIVIKPERAYVPGVAPYMKVRNKEYLRLTYGFDYDLLDVKKEKLIKNKNIRRKLSTSIKEYELGRQLLNIKHSEIGIENSEWVGLIVQLITEQEGEKDLDPRL